MSTVEIESRTGEKASSELCLRGCRLRNLFDAFAAGIPTYDRRAGLTLQNDPVLYLIPDADRKGESVVSIVPAL